MMETVTWPDHGSSSFKRLQEFYCNQALCDVSLIAQDGTTFKAHQLLLAINSSFFHWVFHGWRETNERVTELKTDIEPHVLDALLSLIYQGEVKIPASWSWRQKILEAANTFQLPGIAEALHVTADRGVSYQTEQRNTGTGFQTEQRNTGTGFEIEQQNTRTGFRTEQRNTGTGFETKQRNTGTGFETEQRNTGTGFETEQRNTGTGFETEQRNTGTGFQTEQGNTGTGFQTEQRNTRTGFHTEQQNTGTGFQTEQQNSGTGFETGQRNTGTEQLNPGNGFETINRDKGAGFQIEPRDRSFVHNELQEGGTVLHTGLKDNRTGLQMGTLDMTFPQTSQCISEENMPQCQLSQRSVEFLRGTQHRLQSGCSVPSSTSTGLYATSCGQSTGAGVLHFDSHVSTTCTSVGIQRSQAISSLSDVHSTNVIQSVNVSTKSNGSENRWDIEQRTFVAPNVSIQKSVSNMQFNPPPTFYKQQQDKNSIPVLQTSLLPNQFSSRYTEKEDHITGHVQSLSHRQIVGDKSGGASAKLDSKDPDQNKLESKYEDGSDLDLKKDRKSYGYNKDTISFANAEQVLSSRDEIIVIPSSNVIAASKSVGYKENVSQTSAEYRTSEVLGHGDKTRQLKTTGIRKSKNYNFGSGLRLTKTPSEKQTRSKSISKTETATQTVIVKRNTKASKQRVDTSHHPPVINTKGTRRCKTKSRSTESLTRKTKLKKESKLKSKKGMHRVKKSSRNKKSKLQNITKISKKKLKASHKAAPILPKGPRYERKLFVARTLRTVSHKYQVHLWLRSLYRASRLHPNLEQLLKCFLCSKQFKWYSQWRLHSLAVHIQPKKALDPGQRSKTKEAKGGKKKPQGGECLTCTECGSLYTLRKTLKFHLMQVHHMTLEQIEVNSELLIKCELNGCHFASIDFGELERHAKSEHPAVKYKCPHCQRPRMFYLLAMLDKHITKVHGDKPRFTCAKCGQQFIKYVYLQEHERDNHGIQHSFKLFRCDVEGCDYKTVRKVFLDKHKRLGHTEHKCPHCFLVVKTQDTLQTHIRTMHLNIRPFLCDICGMGFAKEPVLRLHVKTKHNREKEHKCQYCPYGTNVHWYLANHVFHRHGVRADFDNRKEISCPHCNVKYLTNSYLQKHIRNVHDHTFKSTCDVCGKSYKSYSAMSTHRKVHQDVEQKCPHCAYSSKTGEHMKLHIRTQHTFKGMKPYGCPYCTYCSAMGGNVRKHVMHKHPGEEVRYNTNKEQILYMQITEAEMGQSSQDKDVSRTKT